MPLLLAAGALARGGHVEYSMVVGLSIVACLLSDVIWYEIGRRSGGSVLRWLCRISLEPDSCVRTTENVFARHGAPALIVAKFVPGLNTVAPPMSGILLMPYWRFLLFDLVGSLLWVVTFTGIGYLLSDQLEAALARLTQVGGLVGVLLFGGIGTWVAWKLWQRRRLVHELRMHRISAEELRRKIEAGEDVVVIDLRHAVEQEADPESIPGAMRMSPDEIEQRPGDIPRGREVVLFCT